MTTAYPSPVCDVIELIASAQEVMSNCVEQVDLTVGEVNFHAHLPDEHLAQSNHTMSIVRP